MALQSTTTTTVTAPPKAKKAKYLRDADGHIYLWTPELAQHGHLLAAYDPDNPDEFKEDFENVALNRELEIAKEKAEQEEAARLEAVRTAEQAEAARAEANEIAQANARKLAQVQQELEDERLANAKYIAELEAQIQQLAKGGTVEPKDEDDLPEEKPNTKRKAPAKKVKEQKETEEDPLADLDD